MAVTTHPARASLTALGTSLMRAHHTRSAREPLIDDPWGERLVSDPERATLREVLLSGLDAQAREPLNALDPDELLGVLLRSHTSYGTVIIRTRYTEDALAATVACGVRQFVIIGAGMDSFALRRPPFASEVEVFEIDHPATQELKLRRFADRGLGLPRGVHFVAADLAVEGIDDALARSTFDAARPSFFSWLGVTPYLTRAANLKTLRAIASCGTRGSQLVFDFHDQREYDTPPSDEGAARVRAQLARVGEEWRSGFHPSELGGDLRAVGLELIEDLSPDDLRVRYCAGSEDALVPSTSHHIARARVAA
jgi:methyltransferase (TIGR00027 family)